MEPFIAALIFRINCDDVRSVQYEEQWRLIYAGNHEAALEQARQIGQEEEATFPDRLGRLISWQFVAVKSLEAVALSQGALLFSSVTEVETIASPEWYAAETLA